MVTRYNVVVPRKYMHNGEEKTQWNPVGTLVQFPGNGDKPDGFILELGMFPDTTFKVFPQNEDRPKKAASEDDEW